MSANGSHEIHPTAIVGSRAELDSGVIVGPYCIIEDGVRVGARTRLHSHVVLLGNTSIGPDCVLHTGCVLGDFPQDHKYKGECSYLTVGARNIVREYVTLHRATGEGEATVIGDDNMIMAYSHIGHNCRIGSSITIANQVGLSGHVVVEDRVVLGGMVGIHQYVRVGTLAMVGGYSKVVQDVPPYMMADGRPSKVYDLNVVGLRRAGVPAATRSQLKHCVRLLFRSNYNLSQAIEAIENEIDESPEREYLLDFLRNEKFGTAGRQMQVKR
jgi:UDP-N-acetylglucosamine acyltransferase